jgi:predicted Ser/Thr protein kinase/tetratricopeptide (TPR) repeat protein
MPDAPTPHPSSPPSAPAGAVPSLGVTVQRDTVDEEDADPQRTQSHPGVAPSSAGSTAHPPPVNLPAIPGYEVLAELGRGGMGVVYKARQTSLKRLVALKMILSHAHAGPEERARFQTEAEAVARLQHPNIVQVYEVGEHDGLSYFSLEFVEGGSLTQRLAGGPLPADAAALLAVSLARAMHHAHQRGVVHRDLKPANVLLSADGEPKIADFGLARKLETDSGQTRSGAILGTPSYMAPEQAAGDTHRAGPAADTYALGAILYECLTGRPPFRGATLRQTLEMVCTQDPLPPSRLQPGVPRDLETICLKCLAKEPERRYATALALANDLDRFRAGEPILGRREGPARRLWRRLRRRPRTAAAAVLAVLLLVLSAALAVHFSTRSRRDRLEREIVLALEELDPGSAEQVGRVKDLIGDLERIDSGTEWRQRLLHRQVQAVEGLIRQARPEAERIRQGIALVAEQDGARAAALGKQFEDRQRRWEPVIDLTPPYSTLDAVFAPGSVVVEGGKLRPRGDDNRVLTQVACPASAEVQAVFRFPDGAAVPVGVVLNATPTAGYAFVLEPAKKGPGKASDAKDEPPAHARLLRNGVVLRQEVVAAFDPRRPVTLWLKRDGNRLTFRVDDAPPLEFRDPFPPAGSAARTFGLAWPAGATLEGLTASRPTEAAAPSSLEQADALYDAGRYHEALAHYRREGVAGGAAALEARCKEGLCLLAGQRDADALAVFREVGAASGEDWPSLADTQAWLLITRRGQPGDQEQADALLERLSARGMDAGQLAALVPQEMRDRILAPTLQMHNRAYLYEFLLDRPEQVVARARRANAVCRLFVTDPTVLNEVRSQLLRAHLLSDQDEAVLRLGREILAGYAGLDGSDVPRRTLGHMSWVLLRQKRGGEALALLDSWIFRPPNSEGTSGLARLLRLERARVLAALGRLDEADKEVGGVLQALGRDPDPVVAVEAHLLDGFLRERRGDAAGAKAAWARGAAVTSDGNPEFGSVSTQTYQFLMAGLSDTLTDEAIQRVRGRVLEGGAKKSFFVDMATSQISPEIYRNMWRTPRGREIARRMAWREASFGEFFRLPVFLLVTEMFRQGAFAGPVRAEEDELVWDMVRNLYTDFIAGKVQLDHVSSVLAVWKGASLFWEGVAPRLSPSVRGPLAYVLGHRYRRRNQPRDAETFFRAARADAAADSVLHKLATAELESASR